MHPNKIREKREKKERKKGRKKESYIKKERD